MYKDSDFLKRFVLASSFSVSVLLSSLHASSSDGIFQCLFELEKKQEKDLASVQKRSKSRRFKAALAKKRIRSIRATFRSEMDDLG